MKKLDSRLRGNNGNNENGFILPAAVMLVFFLTISGTTFFQLNSLEIQNAWTELGKQTAFYLANTGIERAKVTLKIPTGGAGAPSWTSVLRGLEVDSPPDPLLLDGDPATNPDPRLCPNPNADGCVVPPFQSVIANALIINNGDPVLSPDIPFQGTFNRGSYSVRAYNNGGIGDSGRFDEFNAAGNRTIQDGDRQMMVRALGNVDGFEKVIEVKVQAATGLNLINCQSCDPSSDCPNSQGTPTNLVHMEGRKPSPICNPPRFDEPFYRDPANLPCTSVEMVTGNLDLITGNPNQPSERKLQDGYCYYATGDITLKGGGNTYNNVVIFSDMNLYIESGTLLNSIAIAIQNIAIQGNVELHHALQSFPAIITKGNIVQQSDHNVRIFGNVYVEGSLGDAEHPLNPARLEGIIIGGQVYLKASATVSDNSDLGYYAFMPGFIYTEDDKAVVKLPNTWKEIQ